MTQNTSLKNNENEFSIALLTPWIKGTINVDETFIHTKIPNTILGLVPSGLQKRKTPLDQVSEIYISNSYKFMQMLLGLIIAIIGCNMFASSFLGGLLLVIFGVCLFFSGIKTTLTYETASRTHIYAFPFYEAHHLRDFEEHISEYIEKRYSK